MPRIYQNKEKYALEDFQREIRQQQGYYNLMSVRSLARAMDVPHSTLNPKLKAPQKLTVEDLQKLVSVLHPDIGILLTLLGYSNHDICRFKKS